MAAPYKTSSICSYQPIREKHSPGPASCSSTDQSDQRKKGHYGKRREKLAQWQHSELRLRLPVDPHLGQGRSRRTSRWVSRARRRRQGLGDATTELNRVSPLTSSSLGSSESARGPRLLRPSVICGPRRPHSQGACAALPDAFCVHRVRGQGEGLRESGRLGSRIAWGQELADPLQVKGHKRALERWWCARLSVIPLAAYIPKFRDPFSCIAGQKLEVRDHHLPKVTPQAGESSRRSLG